MNIPIKKPNEIKKMRFVGQLAAEVLEMIKPYIYPGISTGMLDEICHKYITNKQKAIAASLGYKGFPKSVCISVNEEVCHGIPNYNKKLQEGDILNIDVTILKDGWHGDTSKMFIVGKPTVIGKKLCKITEKSLYAAIFIIKPGIRLREIGKTIQQIIEKEKFSVVREYCGHGIGKNFHEEPQVLHYDNHDDSIILQQGMTITIEPMVNAGNFYTQTMDDGWTVKTKDNSLSAQYEHTIVVTSDGCEILTIRSDEHLPKIITHKI
ncbi:type I methionyl aminopeptidase [Blochmannia endosymbiont of Camponotus (Colobopsis) obliquus]|uniref:type I methionyl aminopeptidase n=1 Tax=Blochmannia endosymbiont of Camponotus (Colobopsis) obliquus TaxID=1505597 RepID=UPI00061A6AF0|nr:type I methionyl aminopeptidase [Blochmannia endosymbiont of Camponotus (Colobopsis) obliquus]AKC60436.1 methionine aminopeptidase [Blochmannia endosymbiont of Camponotus (Colobopsis) obliquus]